MTSYAEEAAGHRRDADRAYRQHRKDARFAADQYHMAADYAQHAAWLTRHAALWTADDTPALYERLARSSTQLADTMLRVSLSRAQRSRDYLATARAYDAMEARQAAAVAAAAQPATPCLVCATLAGTRAAGFFATRGMDWPVREVAGRTVHLACAHDAETAVRNASDGSLAIGPDGTGRWTVNGHAIPADSAALFAAMDLAPGLDLAATAAARRTETAQAIDRYRASQPAQASPEEVAEMRAAFGPGTQVVDVLTGRRTQL